MLDWPEETVLSDSSIPEWSHPGSNLCLDFHGDPTKAELTVFSDGNHHMALAEILKHFCDKYPVKEVFYATTPPSPILKLLKNSRLRIGNLIISVKPDVFISPPHVLDKLKKNGFMQTHMPFLQNRGNVLLVRKGNPKQISGAADLLKNDVRLFLSNPVTETVSYRGYVDTLKNIAAEEGADLQFLSEPAGDKTVYGNMIHHREAPQAVSDGKADAAVVFYHLALRYIRLFPSLFEIVPLGGTADDPQPVQGNVVGTTHAGIIGNGGRWGSEFIRFLSSDIVSDICSYHGLIRTE